MVFQQTIGSRAQVMNGTAEKTSGGLKKKDLKYNSQGRIVSVKKSRSAKKEQRLVAKVFPISYAKTTDLFF